MGGDGAKKKGGWGVPHATFPTIVEIVSYVASPTVVGIMTGSALALLLLIRCCIIDLTSFAKSLSSNDLPLLTRTPS